MGEILTECKYLCMVSTECVSFMKYKNNFIMEIMDLAFYLLKWFEHKLGTMRQNEKECTNADYILRNKYQFGQTHDHFPHISIEKFQQWP